jgi:hypothetical protein
MDAGCVVLAAGRRGLGLAFGSGREGALAARDRARAARRAPVRVRGALPPPSRPGGGARGRGAQQNSPIPVPTQIRRRQLGVSWAPFEGRRCRRHEAGVPGRRPPPLQYVNHIAAWPRLLLCWPICWSGASPPGPVIIFWARPARGPAREQRWVGIATPALTPTPQAPPPRHTPTPPHTFTINWPPGGASWGLATGALSAVGPAARARRAAAAAGASPPAAAAAAAAARGPACPSAAPAAGVPTTHPAQFV